MPADRSDYRKVDDKIAVFNSSLSRVRLFRDKNTIVLRGYFPKKIGSPQRVEKRQRLALGMKANMAGVQAAFALAKQIDGQLLMNQFQWSDWLKEAPDIQGDSIRSWVERLTHDHWSLYPQNPDKLHAWKKNYQCYFDKLPADQKFTPDILREVLLANSQPGPRQRRGYAIAYGRLADFAGFDGKELRRLSTYSSLNSVRPRNLPADEVIFEVGQRIENTRWRNAYWLMAIYGLRDHELWRCDLARLKDSPAVVQVGERSKTASRLVYPCQGQGWNIELLSTMELPPLNDPEKANARLGEKVSQYFGLAGVRDKIGVPYNLRHCYARRMFEQGWPIELAAKSMGHSVAVHQKQYQAFMNEESFTQVWKRISSNAT